MQCGHVSNCKNCKILVSGNSPPREGISAAMALPCDQNAQERLTSLFLLLTLEENRRWSLHMTRPCYYLSDFVFRALVWGQ